MKIYSAQLKGTTTVATGSNVSLTGSFSGSIYGFDDTIQYSSSVSSDLSNLETKSASVDISLSNINQYTGSNDTKWTTLTNVTSSLIAATGSYATTGSNQFFGTQTFSGSVYIANDLVVQGSSSIQYISASSVSIGTNIVQLNTANPSVRFAGLTIIDSGSIGGSGSFLYDSLQDEFIFVHRGNGTNVTSSHFVLGPETYDSLGNETYLTCNTLSKGTGKEHLVDSCIFDNGTTTCIKNNLNVTGSCHAIFGNVGIGTNIPRGVFDVRVASDRGITVTGTVSSETIISGMQGDVSANLRNLRIAGSNLLFNTGDGTNTSGSQAMTITSGGNVGIGTITPCTRLEVFSTAASGDRTLPHNVLTITAEQGNAPYFPFGGAILFKNRSYTSGLVESSRIRSVIYDDGAPANCGGGIWFETTRTPGGTLTPSLVINYAGNVGIGTCTPLTTLTVKSTNDNGYALTRPSDATTLHWRLSTTETGGDAYTTRYNTFNNEMLFTTYTSGGTGGNIIFRTGTSGAEAERMRISSGGNTCIFCQLSVGPVVVIGNQGGTDTTVLTGGSGQGSALRMNYAGGSYNNLLAGNGDNYFNCLLGKLNAAGGVKFGGGSGTLNHYEAGTWTPQLYWSGGGYYCMSGGNGGNYVRVGNVVSVNYTLQWSGLCGSSGFGGQLRIGGLPFNVGSYRSAGTISAISSGIGRSVTGITWHANTVDPGANFIYWIENDPTGGYGHSPSVGASGLVYSNQVTYTLQ
jgi:hypothetical protein